MKIYILLVLLVMSFLLGLSCISKNELNNINIEKTLFSIVFGFIIMVSIYEVLYIILFFINAKLSTINILFTLIIGLMITINIYRLIKNRIKFEFPKLGNSKLNIILFVVLIAIIICQMIFLKKYSFYYGYANDEYLYAATSSLALYSNRIISNSGNEISLIYFAHYSLCCWEIFTTWFSWIFNIDVAETLHLYLAMYIVLMVYCVYGLLSFKIFTNAQNRLLFLIASVFLTWYAYYNWISLSGQIIATPWYGRSAMFVIIIPLLFYLIIGNVERKNILLTHLVTLAGCSMSMTGMMTIGFTLGCLLVTNLILRRFKKSLLILSFEIVPVLFLLVYLITS